MTSSASPSETELPQSRADSLLHGICIHPATSLPTADPVGAGLPAMASVLSHQLRLRRRHRWRASSHRFCIHAAISLPHLALCGSWLASDGVLPVTSIAPAPPSSLESQLPQVFYPARQTHWHPSSHKDLHPQGYCRCTHFYCPCGAGSGSLVTRNSPHNPEVLP